TAGFEPTTPTPPVWCAPWLPDAPTRHQNLMMQQRRESLLRGPGIIPQFIEIANTMTLKLSGFQYIQQLLQLHNHLRNQMCELGGITRLRVVAHLQTGATDCKTLIVKQCADLADCQYILSLIITAITTPLNRLQLGKLLFPITQHVRLYSA